MTMTFTLRRLALSAAVALLAYSPVLAQEQRIVAVVNDDIVSNFDIDGRIALTLVSTGAPDSPDVRQRMRAQILRQLIDERIQIQEAKRLGLTIPKAEIDDAIKRIEQSNKLPPGGLDQILRGAGVPRSAMDRQIEATIAWQRLVTGRLRSQIEVSRDEVDEALARYTQGEPVTEYLLSEIFVAIDNPDQEDDVRRSVDDLVKQLVSGAIPFAVAAQQFSQAASAADGGDIGWVQRGQFDPETESILATTDAGRMTQAIRSPSGFYLYGMRDKRVLAPASPDDARVDIAQIVLPVPAGATPADRDSVMALAETIRETVQGCADLERVATEMRVPAPVRVPEVRVGDLAASTRDRIRPLKVGETTEPTVSDGGIGMAMVCVRTEPQSNLPTAADIEDNLIRQRLDNAARRYLRDLRRVAVVDIRA
jgi:peptidyl-prolyl cis-trans isomerase SurA